MSNIRLSWSLPVVTPRQYPIQHVRVEFRVSDTLPWTVQDTVPPDVTQELLFQDVAAGTHFYQVIVVDENGGEGAPATVSADVGFDAPGTVLNLTATIE